MTTNYEVNIWAVLGESKTGKSTVIKSLTSRDGGSPHAKPILLRGGGFLWVFSKVMAWQEDNKSPADAVDEIHRFAQRQESAAPTISIGQINVLMALRLKYDEDLGQPEGHKYLSYFVKKGMKLRSLVLMSPGDQGEYDHYQRFGVPTFWHYNSRKDEMGWMIGKVRNHFGWA